MRNSLSFMLTAVIPVVVLSASSCNSKNVETVESTPNPQSSTRATVTYDTPLIQPVEEGEMPLITPHGWSPVDNPSSSKPESERSNGQWMYLTIRETDSSSEHESRDVRACFKALSGAAGIRTGWWRFLEVFEKESWKRFKLENERVHRMLS